MLKPNLLRKTISQHVPWVRENPDRLVIYVQRGNIVSHGGVAAAFEFRYTLEVLAMDYPGTLDDLAVPVLLWAREYQPDLLFNPERRKDGIKFDADLLSNSTMDVLISIQVDESVVVEQHAGNIRTRHRADTPPDLLEGMDSWAAIISDTASVAKSDDLAS
ncbi:phage tail protein [Brenneria uluponensis]|uniref:phage tail protein n=1 Tax=Brenneria uluponensis TaxID=3057057 RepID=UPI0028E24526|nr:phage tail protein [Brenneria ulupoensis]